MTGLFEDFGFFGKPFFCKFVTHLYAEGGSLCRQLYYDALLSTQVQLSATTSFVSWALTEPCAHAINDIILTSISDCFLEVHMQSLTIRGIDPELKNKLKQAASCQKKSINQFILEIIRKELGLKHDEKFSKEYNDLDDLFGRWSEEEYSAVSRKIDAERQIDQELWT